MRYLPLTPDDRASMLATIGVRSIDDLFVDVPPAARRDGVVDLPLHAGEFEVERELMACVPKKDWIFFSHAMILHGRRVCKALSPACDACSLRRDCPQRGLDADE